MPPKDCSELSKKVLEFCEPFDDCPPFQAVVNGSFALYLYGSSGMMYLVLLAASVLNALDRIKEDE